MASITFAQFLYGEIGQESGGNYQAISPGGAYGKYQILASNIPEWSREILGHSIDAQTFINSPELQDKIAIGMLYRYFTKYGPEGAASAWYTGNPDAWKSAGGGDNYGGPSAAGYVQSVMARAQTYRGNGSDLTHSGQPVSNGQQVANLSGTYSTSADAGGGGGGGNMTKADYLGVDSLGSLLNSVPELRRLLNQAAAHDWSVQRFENAVEDSHWWKQHSQTARSAIIERANDPASWQQTLSNTKNSITSLAHQLGMPLTADELNAIANHALLTGNDSNQQWLTSQISRRQDYSDLNNLGSLQGGMAATSTQLQQMAAEYGFRWTPAQVAERAQRVVSGQTTLDTYQTDLISWAKSAFPALSAQIDAGQTVKQLADPYVQSMSTLLEVDPGTLSVYTPTIRRALQGVQDPKSKERTAINLSDFEDQVREDPRWQYTQNAKDTASSLLLKIGADWGFGPEG